MKVLVRIKRLAPSDDVIVEVLRQGGERGYTARELSGRLPGKPDPCWVRRRLSALASSSARTVKMEWVPCPDWRKHYAVQEGRYWVPSGAA